MDRARFMQQIRNAADRTAEIIRTTIALEAHSLDFYLRLIDETGTDLPRGTLIRIAQEERDHLRALQRLGGA